MGKIILLSKEVYSDYDSKGDLKGFFCELMKENNKIVFMARQQSDVDDIKEYFAKNSFTEECGFYVVTRDYIKSNLKTAPKKSRYVIIGNRDRDFELAVNNKVLYLVPMWCKEICRNSVKYGVNIDTLEQARQIIKTANNQNAWFYQDILPDGTKVYSLMSGMYKIRGVTPEERELVVGFENFLKRGKRDYYEILYYHFMAAISNLDEFRNIDIWGIAPSSGLQLNKDMLVFKDKARCMMKKRFTRENENLFIRHTQIEKSHYIDSTTRAELGATRHLDTIKIDSNYKVKGKNICIFDDYLTHGNTFEAMRILLKAAGAKNIIFVSLGRFRHDYIYQDINIIGDVATDKFEYQEIGRANRSYNVNGQARQEVTNLYEIFNL